MNDPNDVMGRIRALLDEVCKPEPPKAAAPKDVHRQRREREPGEGSAEVDALVIENRNLKTQLEDVRLRLEKAEKVYSADQISIANQKELLQQAETALTHYQSQITTLQTQLTTQAQSVMNHSQAKERAEVTMHAAKTQLSKIAKEKHELVVELGKMREALEKAEKRFKYAEDARSQLSQEVKNLQQRLLRPTVGEVANLREKARASDLKLKTTEDQVKHLRLQNDALLLQVQAHRRKESPHPDSTNHPPPNPSDTLPTTPTHIPLLPTSRDLVGRPWDLIWRVLLDNLPTITQYIPILFRLITAVDPSATRKIRHKGLERGTDADTEPSNRGTMVSGFESEWKRKKPDRGEEGMTKADTEQKLMADKAALKQLVHDREKELSKTKERMESLLIQNRKLNEEFRDLERASQEASRRKREKAILRANNSLMVPDRPSSRSANPIPNPRPQSAHEAGHERLQVQHQAGQDEDERITHEVKLKFDVVPEIPQTQAREAPKPDYSQLLTPDTRPIQAVQAVQAAHTTAEQGGIPMDILAKVLGKPQPINDPFIGLDKLFGNELVEKDEPDGPKQGHEGQDGQSVQTGKMGQMGQDRAEVEVAPVRSSPEESPSSFIYGGGVV